MSTPARLRMWLAAGLLIPLISHAVAREANAQALPEKQATEKKTDAAAPFSGLDKIGKRATLDHKAVDIFKGKSWYVPPPKPKPKPPPPPPPPPPPTAPPMPYAFMGSYQGDDGRLVFFLTRGDKVYSVSSGDVIDGIYRVGEVVSGQLVLIYLPLNIRQTINIGEAS